MSRPTKTLADIDRDLADINQRLHRALTNSEFELADSLASSLDKLLDRRLELDPTKRSTP